MTDMKKMGRILTGLVVATFLAACASSSEVRQLAEKTAANTSTLAAAIESMSQQSRRLAERRAANAARLAAATARVNARVELDRALLRQSGEGGLLDTAATFKSWSEKVRAINAAGVLDEAALIRSILTHRSDIESRSKALSELAEILAALAKKESKKGRAKFLLNFGKEVYKQVKEKRKEADAAIKKGEKALAAKETEGGGS